MSRRDLLLYVPELALVAAFFIGSCQSEKRDLQVRAAARAASNRSGPAPTMHRHDTSDSSPLAHAGAAEPIR